ncbi:MAG: translation initiation factor IF-2 [Elusimicrobia bacterium RIFCSPLOWO2_01_FULL_59_12]|nr:MAG: translation initiation factor IF-2 [Elusimicrobia bacterium RIFCSPLOWO2_01_FULL_59_12]
MPTKPKKSDPEPAPPKKADETPKKRMVLKTLKRVTSSSPVSPMLRKVTPGVPTRRVIPKAPPPRPKPIEPAAPPPPVLAAPAPAPAPVAKAPVEAAPPPAQKVPEKKETLKKETPKVEPTATYKMPPPPTVKPPRPAVPRMAPSHPAPSASPAPGRTEEPAAAAGMMGSVPPAAPRQKIKISEIITVKELAERLNVKAIDVIKKLLSLGSLATINQQIDATIAALAAEAFNTDVEIIPILQDAEVEDKDDPATLKPRPPIVTIMGHVDHGKTSLLDAIRSTRVAEKEAGGITQHIGAYRVSTPKGDVVFLDTPGHEAFTAMRARGAQATDVVVLVVAADDGVMPQTIEAIDHAKAAGVNIVVAVNKIDLPTANPERIKRDLSPYQLVPEDWGGKTIFVEVSAKKRTNIDKLLEMLSLESELLELKANPDRPAQGVVVEARLDPRRGVTATLLVQKGTLKVGDAVVAGTTFGKVRAMFDDRGGKVEAASPSTPVEVLGLSNVPQAGERFTVLSDEREARTLVERRQLALNENAVRRKHVTLDTLHDRVAEGKIRELKIIIKGDVQGSVQAVKDAVERLSTHEIRLNVIHSGVGAIKETDVTLASASDAVVIGFNVRPDAKAEETARREDVDIRTYRIIYELIDNIKAAMEGLLEPETQETRVGMAEIRQVFHVSKSGNIAGCMVQEGKIIRGGKARLLRDGVVVHVGSIESLKRFKEDAREVEKGFECGIGLGNFQDMKPKDLIEVFTQEQKARKLEPANP